MIMLTDVSRKDDLSLRVLSIDPGTQNLGSAFSIADYTNKQFRVEYGYTFDVDNLVNKVNIDLKQSHSRNIAMYQSVYWLTLNLCWNFHPDWVLCESPYLNSKFPVSYALLTLCTQAVEHAVKDYSSAVLFDYIDPASVKRGVGVKGNSGDKELMKKAIMSHPSIVSNLDINYFDEHTIDAIAIGFNGFNDLLKG